MLLGAAPWQDYVLGDAEPTLAGVVNVVPVTGYDGKWWVMVEKRQAEMGGRGCNYIPRTPSGNPIPILNSTVIVNLINLKGEDGAGNVRIIGKMGVIAAREWYAKRLFTSRPQRGDKIETGQETFYVEDVNVVEKRAPDGVVRDLKFQLDLAGASHRRS